MQERNSILFLGDEGISEEYVRWLVNAGMDVQHLHSPSELRQALHKTSPVAVIIDLGSSSGELELIAQVAAAIGKPEPSFQVLFISGRADQEVRLRAVQAGGSAFLTRPLSPRVLMQQFDPALVTGQDGYRILVIGEMPTSASGFADQLERAGMTIKHLANSSQALLSMINFTPDLLIIAPELRGCRGDELGQVIHQLSDYEELPVILYGDKDSKAVRRPLDPASEWLSPDSMDIPELVGRIDRLITAARVRRKQQRYLQTFDPATGLLNRQGFIKALERGVVADDLVALVLLDLGHIQHQYPDLDPYTMQELLAMVASLLEKLVDPAQLAAHIGDSIFVFLVSRKTREEIKKLGKLLSHSITSRFFNVGQNSLVLGCDTGIAITGQDLGNAVPLFQLALRACEEARRAGNNRICFRSLEAVGRHDRGEDEHRILELLKDAGSSGRFRLVFQPIVSLRGNTVEKYEVLLRLLDANNEFIFPSRFVPVAEHYGLMQSIDRWVVEQTIRTLEKRGRGTRFFNKISSSTLRDDEFVPFVRECIAKHEISGDQLVFEISRSNITSGIGRAATFVAGVTQLGCGISVEHGDIHRDIDSLMEHLPANYVKLDGSVVRDVCEDANMQVRLNAIIKQAKQHDVRVIAACIENANCLQLLWQSGVHYIQGNFLQEPAAALDFDFGS